MPGIVSKCKNEPAAGDDADGDDAKHARRRSAAGESSAREHSSFSDEEVMNHPGMVRLMGYLESLPVEERIVEFTVRSSEEDEQRESQSARGIRETEEARRIREIEEDRKNYMNRFFR